MQFGGFKATLAALAMAGAVALNAMPAAAANFSFTGNLANDDQVQLFTFSVGATSDVTLRTWSYAGGTNAAGAAIARGGFDPILALFDGAGLLIGQNDDGGFNVAADSVTGAHFDTYLFLDDLTAGTYTVAVMQFANFAIGPNLSDGFTGSGVTNWQDATGNLRDSHWAFDILGVDDASTEEPEPTGVAEPASLALFGAALAGLGLVRRRRQA